jgi:hypothetical protein
MALKVSKEVQDTPVQVPVRLVSSTYVLDTYTGIRVQRTQKRVLYLYKKLHAAPKLLLRPATATRLQLKKSTLEMFVVGVGAELPTNWAATPTRPLFRTKVLVVPPGGAGDKVTHVYALGGSKGLSTSQVICLR